MNKTKNSSFNNVWQVRHNACQRQIEKKTEVTNNFEIKLFCNFQWFFIRIKRKSQAQKYVQTRFHKSGTGRRRSTSSQHLANYQNQRPWMAFYTHGQACWNVSTFGKEHFRGFFLQFLEFSQLFLSFSTYYNDFILYLNAKLGCENSLQQIRFFRLFIKLRTI